MGLLSAEGPGWIGRYARGLRTVYFAGFGFVFLVTWVAPEAFGTRFLRTLVLYVILEMIAILTAVALLLPWLRDDGRGGRRTLLALFWVPAGTAFAILTAVDFGIPWAVAPFALSLLAQAGELIGSEPGGPASRRVKYRIVGTFLVFMAAGAVVILLPLPELGLTDAVVARQGFDRIQGTSDFFEQPEAAMAWGSLYFLGLAQAERKDLSSWLAEHDATT